MPVEVVRDGEGVAAGGVKPPLVVIAELMKPRTFGDGADGRQFVAQVPLLPSEPRSAAPLVDSLSSGQNKSCTGDPSGTQSREPFVRAAASQVRQNFTEASENPRT